MRKLFLLLLFLVPSALISEPYEYRIPEIDILPEYRGGETGQVEASGQYSSLATIIIEWQMLQNKDKYSMLATMLQEWPRVKNKCPENIYHVIEYMHYMSDRDNLTHDELRDLLQKILEGHEKPTAWQLYWKEIIKTAGHTVVISGSVVVTFVVCILLNQYVL